MKKYLYVIIAAIMLSACGLQDQISATEYSNNIVAEQSKILNLMIDCVGKYNKGDIAGAKAMLGTIEIQCDSSIAIVQKTGAFKGDDEFRQSALQLFAFYKRNFIRDYGLIFNTAASEAATFEDYQKADALLKTFSLKESKMIKELNDAQMQFAEKYHIKVENNPVNDRIDSLQSASDQ